MENLYNFDPNSASNTLDPCYSNDSQLIDRTPLSQLFQRKKKSVEVTK